MERRKLIIIKDANYTLKETYIDTDEDTIWEVTDPKNENTFMVHSSNKGELYITFFKKSYISSKCSINSVKKICEILLERNLTPSIHIHPKNTYHCVLKLVFRK